MVKGGTIFPSFTHIISVPYVFQIYIEVNPYDPDPDAVVYVDYEVSVDYMATNLYFLFLYLFLNDAILEFTAGIEINPSSLLLYFHITSVSTIYIKCEDLNE